MVLVAGLMGCHGSEPPPFVGNWVVHQTAQESGWKARTIKIAIEASGSSYLLHVDDLDDQWLDGDYAGPAHDDRIQLGSHGDVTYVAKTDTLVWQGVTFTRDKPAPATVDATVAARPIAVDAAPRPPAPSTAEIRASVAAQAASLAADANLVHNPQAAFRRYVANLRGGARPDVLALVDASGHLLAMSDVALTQDGWTPDQPLLRGALTSGSAAVGTWRYRDLDTLFFVAPILDGGRPSGAAVVGFAVRDSEPWTR